MKLKIIPATLLVILLVATGLSCVQAGPGIKPEVSVILKELTTDDTGQTVLIVTVKNTGHVKADFAEVVVKFYDFQKNLLDSNRDSVLGLGTNETWEFKIPCSAALSKVSSYEIETNAGASTGGL